MQIRSEPSKRMGCRALALVLLAGTMAAAEPAARSSSVAVPCLGDDSRRETLAAVAAAQAEILAGAQAATAEDLIGTWIPHLPTMRLLARARLQHGADDPRTASALELVAASCAGYSLRFDANELHLITDASTRVAGYRLERGESSSTLSVFAGNNTTSARAWIQGRLLILEHHGRNDLSVFLPEPESPLAGAGDPALDPPVAGSDAGPPAPDPDKAELTEARTLPPKAADPQHEAEAAAIPVDQAAADDGSAVTADAGEEAQGATVDDASAEDDAHSAADEPEQREAAEQAAGDEANSE
ncbi:MAG: hypothetical protein ACOCYV_02865 [Planctomycetota bacterium]